MQENGSALIKGVFYLMPNNSNIIKIKINIIKRNLLEQYYILQKVFGDQVASSSHKGKGYLAIHLKTTKAVLLLLVSRLIKIFRAIAKQQGVNTKLERDSLP